MHAPLQPAHVPAWLPARSYLPRSIEERELVARTVFVGNIDRVVEREQLCEFFANLCGEELPPTSVVATMAGHLWRQNWRGLIDSQESAQAMQLPCPCTCPPP